MKNGMACVGVWSGECRWEDQFQCKKGEHTGASYIRSHCRLERTDWETLIKLEARLCFFRLVSFMKGLRSYVVLQTSLDISQEMIITSIYNGLREMCSSIVASRAVP